MRIDEMRLAVGTWLKRRMIHRNITIQHFLQTYSSMCRSPRRWGIPTQTFGNAANEDWITIWEEINFQRFGVWHDKRTCPEQWRFLPRFWLRELLVRGTTPVMLASRAGADLKKAEAHAWLCDLSRRRSVGEPIDTLQHPYRWLLRDWGADMERKITIPLPRSKRIVDWLLRKETSTALLKRRKVPRADGTFFYVQYINMLDEIQDRDLENGAKTSVDRVFASIKNRQGENTVNQLLAAGREYPPLPWVVDVAGVTQIRNSIQLAEMSSVMTPDTRCVAGYNSMCRSGSSFLLHIVGKDGDYSLAEITAQGTVRQHRTHQNKPASKDCWTILQAWLVANHLKKVSKENIYGFTLMPQDRDFYRYNR